MKVYMVSWSSFDLSNIILAALLVASLLIVHQCGGGNDYSDHEYTAGRAERLLK